MPPKKKQIITEGRKVKNMEPPVKKQEIQEMIKKKFPTTLVIIGVVILSIPVLIFIAAFGYKEMYKGKVYPGVFVSNQAVGGYTEQELQEWIHKFNANLQNNGLSLVVQKKLADPQTISIPLTMSHSNNTSSTALVHVGTDVIAGQAYSVGRVGGYARQLLEPITFLVRPVYVNVTVDMEEAAIKAEVQKKLASLEDRPHNATVAVTSVTPLKYEIIPEKAGRGFNYEAILKKVQQKLSRFDNSPTVVTDEEFFPTITAQEVSEVLPRLEKVLSQGMFMFRYVDDKAHSKKEWKIPPENFALWLEVQRNNDNQLSLGLNKDQVAAYLNSDPAQYVNLAPQDAVFRMEGDKVVEFKASRVGQHIDVDSIYQSANELFWNRTFETATTNTVMVVAKSVEPTIKTGEVNNLGISDVVGVGISTFRDSHNNRIRNIANAVKRLNGTLIKPDEEFSANRYAGPYISANGYLPEAVIKGDEIKNEIGGGMCQIGTTLFRMAMNSGMDITERRNHSLVVGYYADPVNGNPGTDATLYEPILDLKFKNDTGNYLLLQTDIDYTKQQLTFTLWGKPDGRSGSYTHPIVERWIGAGAPRIMETDTLPPGKQKCQGAFPGAVASFTYTRLTPAGEKIDRVFESYYRPLPKICMVGKTTCPEGQTCDANGQAVSPLDNDVIEPVPITDSAAGVTETNG